MENLSVRRGSRSIFSCSTSQVVGVPMPLALEWYLFRSTQPHPRKRSLLPNQRAPVSPLQSALRGTQNHQSRSEKPKAAALPRFSPSQREHTALPDFNRGYDRSGSMLLKKDFEGDL